MTLVIRTRAADDRAGRRTRTRNTTHSCPQDWTADHGGGMMSQMDAPARMPGADAAPEPAPARRPRRPDLSPLVKAAGQGDEQAFRELYRAVQPGLLRYLRTLV